MALVNQTLKLEITTGGVPPKLHVTEYDENMQVVAQLFQRGQYYEIPSGTTAKVEGTLAGHPFSADATVDGSNVTFELTKSMTAYAGRAWTKIKLTKDGKPVSTCGFWLECDRAGVEAGDVIGAPGFEEQIKDAVDEWLDEHGGVSMLPGTVPENVALLEDVTADEASGDFIPMLSPNGTEYRLSIGDDGVPVIKNANGTTVWSGTSGGSSGGGEEPGGDNPGSDTPTGEWQSGAEVAYTLVDGEWVKDDGSFASGDGDSRTDFIYCYGAGHIYHSCAGSNSVRVVFYDINKQFVSKQSGYYRYNAIPENAAYVVMSFTTAGITGSVIKLYKKVEPTWTDGQPYEFTFIENEYVNGSSGEFVTYSGWKRTDYVNCAGATKITKTNASTRSQYGGFYNAEKERITSMITPDTTGGTSADITVPVGACYFLTSDSNANMDALVLIPYA